MKKIVMVIAHEGFRDEEYLEPKRIFENNDFKVTVASSRLTDAVGKLGARVKPDILVKNIDVKDYDGIVLIGGPGAREYFKDKLVHNLLNTANQLNKVISAICIAPNILANAGLLKGVKATCWDSDNLINKGAEYTGSSVEVSGRIITGKGPFAAEEFAEAIVAEVNK